MRCLPFACFRLNVKLYYLKKLFIKKRSYGLSYNLYGPWESRAMRWLGHPPPPVVMRHVAFLVMFAFFTSYISSSLYFLLYFYLCTLTFVVSPSVMPPTLLYFVTLKWMCSVYISFLVVTFPSHIL